MVEVASVVQLFVGQSTKRREFEPHQGILTDGDL